MSVFEWGYQTGSDTISSVAMKPFDSSNRIWNFLAALSLANVCFLSVWRELIIVNAADSYWFPDYTSESYLAIMINVFAKTLIAYNE